MNYGNGTNGGIHLSSNAYLTFGGGASAYKDLGASNPPFPTLFLGAGDNSVQRVYAGLEPGGSYRVRYEGAAATTGSAGAPNIVFEIVFEPSGALQVAIGAHARCPGGACVTGISDGGGGWYLYNPNTSVALDTRYRLEGLSNASLMVFSAGVGGSVIGSVLSLPPALRGASVVAVAAGDAHSMALLADGRVLSWGCDGASNHGAQRCGLGC